MNDALSKSHSHLRSFWRKWLHLDWELGLILILLFGISRFILVLNANVTGQYHYVSIIFLMMWVAPFILLNREGRQNIGLRMPSRFRWILWGFLIGIGTSVIVYFVADVLYHDTMRNWFVYISTTYNSPGVNVQDNRLVLFLIFATVSMTFSPIGEEFLYRGLIHTSLVPKFGENKASILDSLAFALTHLAHFGIVYIHGEWTFFALPAFLWVTMMFLVSRLFYFIKQRSGSIWGAVITHAGFNLGMTYMIFYWILI